MSADGRAVAMGTTYGIGKSVALPYEQAVERTRAALQRAAIGASMLNLSRRIDRMKRILALLAFAALPLAAQQPGMMGRDHQMMPHMMQMQQMMAPMMRAMAFTPDHLLARKDSLNLTQQQITRLTALQDAARTAHDAAAKDARAHMEAIAEAFKAASPDSAALRTHFQAAHEGMGKAHWVMLAAAAQARAVLTPEQRGRVEQWPSPMMMK
jgi:Spy/CpxP family protein refolding chaperone